MQTHDWAHTPGPFIGPTRTVADHELVREMRKTIEGLKDENSALALSLADAEEVIMEQQALIKSLRSGIEMWKATYDAFISGAK